MLNFLELNEKNKLHHEGLECEEAHPAFKSHIEWVIREVRNHVDRTGNYKMQTHRIRYNNLLKDAKSIFFMQFRIHVLDHKPPIKDESKCKECKRYSRSEKNIKELESLVYSVKPHTPYVNRSYNIYDTR
ncbi:MAG: hypothetical protein CL907_03605 [Dehalococcoidia bacterium]|nr:hypothetical protein [Dehalococcoidia bacterium]